MAGRSQASNLGGLLTSIGDTVGQMGGAGHQYVDTFRRTMAPKVDTEDSTSLKDYSLWARRNGYQDEANRYEAMAIERQKVEGMQAFKQANLNDSTIMRKIHGADTSKMTEAQRAALDEAYNLAEQRMNQRGADYEGGKGTEGSDMTSVLAAEDAARVKLARDIEAHSITVQKERDRRAELAAAGQLMPADSLSKEDYKAYLRAMNAAIDDAGRKRVNEMFKPQFDAHRKTVEANAKATAIRDINVVVSEMRESDKKNWWFDGPLSAWMADEDNATTIASAVEATQAILATHPDYIDADEAGKKEIAARELKKYLKEFDPKYKRAEKDYRNNLEEEEAANKRRQNNANRPWTKGRDAGGVAYQESLASFKRYLEKQGIPFTSETQSIFDQQWDEDHGNQGNVDPRITDPTAGMGVVY